MNHHTPDPADLVAATAEEIVAAIAEDAERIARFRRRWLLALHDLGWLELVGPDWIRIGQAGLDFGQLSFKAADELLRDLEDYGRRPSPGRVRCRGQLRLPLQ